MTQSSARARRRISGSPSGSHRTIRSIWGCTYSFLPCSEYKHLFTLPKPIHSFMKRYKPHSFALSGAFRSTMDTYSSGMFRSPTHAQHLSEGHTPPTGRVSIPPRSSLSFHNQFALRYCAVGGLQTIEVYP